MSDVVAKDVMVSPVVSVREETSLEEVAKLLLEHKIGAVVVVDARNEVAGIITENDFMARSSLIPFSTFEMPKLFEEWVGRGTIDKIYERARTISASKIMRRSLYTAEEETPIEDVIELMLRHNVKRIPVVRGKTCVGIVARHDILRMAARTLRRPA